MGKVSLLPTEKHNGGKDSSDGSKAKVKGEQGLSPGRQGATCRSTKQTNDKDKEGSKQGSDSHKHSLRDMRAVRVGNSATKVEGRGSKGVEHGENLS